MPATTPTIPAAYTQRPDELVCALIRAGWSQEQIADATDVSQPTICRIYSGRHKDPRYSVVENLMLLYYLPGIATWLPQHMTL
ncbi:DNA-binding helix-turn-helix protein [Bordetella bronchiseptica D993]|nr:DNA-binding helix-turn-helix protein [Bordetella bronchiseptica D993]